MSRSLTFSAAMILAGLSGAAAQDARSLERIGRRESIYPLPHRVLANGRCNGISYGTGARRCGTATGGPSGGLSSRN